MPRILLIASVWLCASVSTAADLKPFDSALAFGRRTDVADLTLAPDGLSVAYVVPRTSGPGSVAVSLSLAKGSKLMGALTTDGAPYRLRKCNWVSLSRLVCTIYGVVKAGDPALVPVQRIVAVNTDGSNLKVLSNKLNQYSRGYALGAGEVVDWLPDENGAVLMSRDYLPDDHLGSHLGSDARGLGVDRIDTQTMSITHVVNPIRNAIDYISDGRGNIRVVATQERNGDGRDTGIVTFNYRPVGTDTWKKLSEYDSVNHTGFWPLAVDHDLNIAYGLKRKDGRRALYSVKLDETLHEELVYAREDVDVDSLIRIGRRQRVVGVSYVTDVRRAVYFDKDIEQLSVALAAALPKHPALRIADSNTDESKLLIFARSDSDPGVYYVFDRKTHELATFLVARNDLEGAPLATEKPVTYPGPDGVGIPGYLTLPPGKETAKGLPAIVLPHGGPSARDEWGFDWLSQFYASRGYAVLQPNFRGSAGYGDAWFKRNGFQSWEVAIGDVLAGGRWLVSEGIADPSKLAIVGWSYGGYAALQSAVTDSSVFKAVVAIAPVTDLGLLKEQNREWSNYYLAADFIGSGPHMHDGSPDEHADKIKVPVLLFHGTVDRNVSIDQSRRMAERLTAAGDKCELVTFDNLDHYLEDSQAREQMLRKSDQFLRQTMGIQVKD